MMAERPWDGAGDAACGPGMQRACLLGIGEIPQTGDGTAVCGLGMAEKSEGTALASGGWLL